MEIGVVVHGPGIVDSGWALKIIDILSNFGNVRCRLGGTMGRTAVIDAGLEDTIDISLKLLPSQSLELFNREHVDVIFLLNYGKSPETGRVFGYKVFSHYFKQISNEDYLATNHKSLYESDIPVIQIERPGEDDGSIISWNVDFNEQLALSKKVKRNILGIPKKNDDELLSFDFKELFEGLKAALELVEVTPEEVVSGYLSNSREDEDEREIEKLIRSYEDYETANYTYRKIHGVSPNENIFINGIVVAYSNADSIVLIARDGIIVDIVNGTIKSHGLEKLGPVDLERVIVKTGLLRKSDDVKPRILSNEEISIKDTERNIYSGEISEDEDSFKVAYVDHAAYDIYKFKDFDLVVTVGDDTSLVASDILYRFNIPIIGITDGDLDKVVENGFVNEKSTFIEVPSGFDDIVGHYINEEMFYLRDTLEVPFDSEASSVEEFKSVMFNIFKAKIIENVKNVVPEFLEKDFEYNEINSYHSFVEESKDLENNLDEFIDDFGYEIFEKQEGDYFEDIDVSSDGVYLDDEINSAENFDDSDLDDISDSQLEEMIAGNLSDEDYTAEEVYFDHGSAEFEEVYDGSDSVEYEEGYGDSGSIEYEEVYVDHGSAEFEEVYVEPGSGEFEEVYDGSGSGEFEEVYVEPGSGEFEEVYDGSGSLEYEEVFIDENGELISADELNEGDFIIVDDFEDSDEEIVNDYPNEDEYLENLVEDEIYYDEANFDSSDLESPVEEIFVEHETGEEIVYDDVPVEGEIVYGDVPVDEEIAYDDVPFEEVYIEEHMDDEFSQDSTVEYADEQSDDLEDWDEYLEDELEDSDEWDEILEEDYDDSINESDESRY